VNRAVILIALLHGCGGERAQRPDFCAVAASAYKSDSCPGQKLATANDDEALYLVHVLPEGVTAPGPVHFRLETACASLERDVEYSTPPQETDRARAIASFVAPKGSGCGLIITATVAGQTQREVLTGRCDVSCGADSSAASDADGATD
jgi:hypothetical protein